MRRNTTVYGCSRLVCGGDGDRVVFHFCLVPNERTHARHLQSRSRSTRVRALAIRVQPPHTRFVCAAATCARVLCCARSYTHTVSFRARACRVQRHVCTSAKIRYYNEPSASARRSCECAVPCECCEVSVCMRVENMRTQATTPIGTATQQTV